MGPIINAPLVSTGAKSGQRREVQLTYFNDGPDVILLASNYGGTKHPQWYHNLKANPDCHFGGEKFTAAQGLRPRRIFAAVPAGRAGLRRVPRLHRQDGPSRSADSHLQTETAVASVGEPAR